MCSTSFSSSGTGAFSRCFHTTDVHHQRCHYPCNRKRWKNPHGVSPKVIRREYPLLVSSFVGEEAGEVEKDIKEFMYDSETMQHMERAYIEISTDEEGDQRGSDDGTLKIHRCNLNTPEKIQRSYLRNTPQVVGSFYATSPEQLLLQSPIDRNRSTEKMKLSLVCYNNLFLLSSTSQVFSPHVTYSSRIWASP
ncbi:hypothetical protein DY000_02038083 [Brassica cretica]|uniref:Uncharacterized protein n=1 Tax=Brassica cretica TaxID=69181 RepID=A0ABQ7BD24_BRACR|nr:hypothetical protein DY000_02038083 [Brassica cretica]